MVVDGIGAHGGHQLIEGQGRRALEHGIGLALLTHTIHDVGTLEVTVDHLGDGVDIVLQVGIDGDDGVGLGLERLHACHQGVLVAGIVGQLHTTHLTALLLELTYQRPRRVLGTVVDIGHETAGRDLRLGGQLAQQSCQAFVGLRQYGFLIIARYDDNESGRGVLCLHNFFAYSFN